MQGEVVEVLPQVRLLVLEVVFQPLCLGQKAAVVMVQIQVVLQAALAGLIQEAAEVEVGELDLVQKIL
jgi:hypothetical protein